MYDANCRVPRTERAQNPVMLEAEIEQPDDRKRHEDQKEDKDRRQERIRS